jgi:hypothetical protein
MVFEVHAAEKLAARCALPQAFAAFHTTGLEGLFNALKSNKCRKNQALSIPK